MSGDEKQRKDLGEVLAKIRDLRKWAEANRLSSWAIRQALITSVELDAYAALDSGVTPKQLLDFDKKARKQAIQWVERMRIKRQMKTQKGGEKQGES